MVLWCRRGRDTRTEGSSPEAREGRRVGVLQEIYRKAAARTMRIALPEAGDERTLRAVPIIRAASTAKPVLVGNPDEIRRKAGTLDVSLDGVEIRDPNEARFLDDAERLYLERTKSRGVTAHEARELVSDPLYAHGSVEMTAEQLHMFAGDLPDVTVVRRP